MRGLPGRATEWTHLCGIGGATFNDADIAVKCGFQRADLASRRVISGRDGPSQLGDILLGGQPGML